VIHAEGVRLSYVCYMQRLKLSDSTLKVEKLKKIKNRRQAD